MTASIFTLAPANLDISDLHALENTCYRQWSTYKRHRNLIRVRTNQEHNAAGQTWAIIARRIDGIWYVVQGRGLLGQGGALLVRYLMDRSEQVNLESPEPWDGKVKRYRATAKVYSLPSLLNGGQAVVSRDKLADQRAKARKSVDFMAAMRARQEASNGS